MKGLLGTGDTIYYWWWYPEAKESPQRKTHSANGPGPGSKCSPSTPMFRLHSTALFQFLLCVEQSAKLCRKRASQESWLEGAYSPRGEINHTDHLKGKRP